MINEVDQTGDGAISLLLFIEGLDDFMRAIAL
jgi:hypothetical protein